MHNNFIGYAMEANHAQQKEYRDGSLVKVPMSFRINELIGEVGEMCNVLKKIESEAHGWKGSRVSPADLPNELADVVHCTLLIALDLRISPLVLLLQDNVRVPLSNDLSRIGCAFAVCVGRLAEVGMKERVEVDAALGQLRMILALCDMLAEASGFDLQDAVVEKFNATSDKLGLECRMEKR